MDTQQTLLFLGLKNFLTFKYLNVLSTEVLNVGI